LWLPHHCYKPNNAINFCGPCQPWRGWLGHAPSKALHPIRFVVNDRGLFTAGWFGVREK